MKIAILEPHYDDCWLSMGGLLLANPEHEYTVITLSKDDNWGNNVNNTQKLSRFLPHFESIDLRYDSLDVDVQKVEEQMQRAGIDTLAALFDVLNGRGSYLSAIERAQEEVCGSDAVFMPLGLSHPMHIALRSWEFDEPVFRYQEYPYAYYPEEADTLIELTKDLETFAYDISRFVDKKERIFREVYPSEAFILSLPECSRALSELDTEIFYSKNGEQPWSALV